MTSLPNHKIVDDLKFLLVVWDLKAVPRKDLAKELFFTDHLVSSLSDFVSEYESRFIGEGVIKSKDDVISLTAAGLKLIRKYLLNPEFRITEEVSGATADRLLRWFRSELLGTTNPITSYEEFVEVALEAFDQLDYRYNSDNFIPIYMIRQTIGNRVDWETFNEWMLKMQASDIFQFVGGSPEGCTLEMLQGSIKTEISRLRFWCKKL